MRRLTFLLAWIGLAACEREPTALQFEDEQLMVHSVLVAGSDTVKVLVTRTLPEPIPDPNAPGGFTSVRPVSGAEVRLFYNGTVVSLSEAPAGFSSCFSAFPFAVVRATSIGPGCYAAVVPGGIRPEQHYGLEVELASGERVEGSTQVPAAPEITTPAPGARVRARINQFVEGSGAAVAVPVRFRLPPSVAGVRVALVVERLFKGGAPVADASCFLGGVDTDVRRAAPVDSAVVVVSSISCSRRVGEHVEQVTPDSISGHILLAGFDSGYVRYAEAASQQSAERERLRVGITGALGLFAGAGTAAQPITLVTER